MGTLNIPASKKLFGANLVLKPTDGGDWRQYFYNWDWTGWIKPQIDALVGNGIGCNAIRQIGSMRSVYVNDISQANYNAHWNQLAAYCGSLGVALYPAPGDQSQTSGMTDAQIATDALNVINATSSACQVIGCDVMQEQNAWTDSNAASRTQNIYNLIKASNSTIPLTFSTFQRVSNEARTFVANNVGALDYLDFHIYASAGPYDPQAPIAASDLNFFRSTYPTLDIFCGEFGFSQSNTADPGNTFSRSVYQAFGYSDPKIRGALMWAGFDQDTSSSNQYGMYSGPTDLTRRSNRALPLISMTGGFVAKRN